MCIACRCGVYERVSPIWYGCYLQLRNMGMPLEWTLSEEVQALGPLLEVGITMQFPRLHLTGVHLLSNVL